MKQRLVDLDYFEKRTLNHSVSIMFKHNPAHTWPPPQGKKEKKNKPQTPTSFCIFFIFFELLFLNDGLTHAKNLNEERREYIDQAACKSQIFFNVNN